jgi:tRNA pseudouridine38-40 synthase
VLHVLGVPDAKAPIYTIHVTEPGIGLRLAFRIAYDGRLFHGFARQPGLRTVEGEVRLALTKSHLIDDVDTANVRGASRTDAGVSAVGNVIAFDTAASEEDAVGRFNDGADDVFAWAVAAVPPGFDPRKANARWYRYHLTGGHDAAKLREVGRPFLGTHDFAAFANPDAERTRRHIDSIEVTAADDGLLLDVRAPSFLRGMVRRIVATLLAVERGDARREEIENALAAGSGADYGQVPPEPLVLMEVDVGIAFRTSVDRAARLRIERRTADALVRARFWREVRDRAAPRTRPRDEPLH